MNRVWIALIGKCAGGMVGYAVRVVLSDIAQIPDGQFQSRDRVAIAGPSGLCAEVGEQCGVVRTLPRYPDLHQHRIGGGGTPVLGGRLERQDLTGVHRRCGEGRGEFVSPIRRYRRTGGLTPRDGHCQPSVTVADKVTCLHGITTRQ